MTPREIQDEVAPLSGTAAKILLVFVMSTVGRSFQAKEVALLAGVSTNAATTAVRLLAMRGILQDNGRTAGWSLKAGWLGVTGTAQPELLPVDNSVGTVDNVVDENQPNHKFCDRSMLSDPKNCDSSQANLTIDHKICDSNPTIDRWIDSNNYMQEESIYLATEANPKNCDSVEFWLARAGVNADSVAWAAIVAMGHTADCVKAHVLEVEADEKSTVGGLIYRLKNRWPAPKMRCEECLQVDCTCTGKYSPEIQKLFDQGVLKR